MWNKIYTVALAIFVLVMLVLTYLTFSQLQSVGFAPAVIAENYLVYESYFQQFLWMSSVALLILANVLLWTEQKSWALWATFLYFAVFVLLQGWWFGRMFSAYQQNNNLPQNAISFGILVSTFICIIAAVGIFFNQFLVLRMRERMSKTTDVNEPDELTPIKENSTDKEI